MHNFSMHERLARLNVPRFAGVASSCLVAALALAALDDITTGVEPHFVGEWVMVALAALWFAGGGSWLWQRRLQQRAGRARHRPEDARP